MKKKVSIGIVAAASVAAVSALAYFMHRGTGEEVNSKPAEDDSEETSEDKSDEIPAKELSEIHEKVNELWRDRHKRGRNRGRVCYYGCPNSKRVEKLNLKKES